MSRRELGGLNCHIVDRLAEGSTPSLAVILCHGFGAPADDLVPLGAELLRTGVTVGNSVRFYFPAAVLDLDAAGLPGGRAWWPIDMQRLVLAGQTGRWDDLRTSVPTGLEGARERLLALVDAVLAETELPLSRIVLGGFSQGAMLAIDVALRLPEPVAAVCLASGALISEPEWDRLAARHKALRVLLSHGRQDAVLPFFAGDALRELLMKHGHSVEFIPFDGGHTIPWPMLHLLAKLLAELAETPR